MSRTLSPPDAIAEAERLLAAGRPTDALRILAELKASRRRAAGVDALRARCFERLGDASSAEQARREELRWFGPSGQPGGVAETLRQPLADDAAWCSAAIEAVRPFTMLSERRLRSLHELARAAAREGIGGAFVECGVAAGGSSALLAGCVERYGIERRVWCFDTFDGMPDPGPLDRALDGSSADESGWGSGTCSAPTQCVRDAAALLGAAHRLVIRPGLFQDTLPVARRAIGPIALLHLDGDWYDSTRTCLVELWDLLAPGAFVQIDDFGHWEGCRRAVEEFFAERGLPLVTQRIDYTGVWLRTAPAGAAR
jgi:hypothetical protein